MKSGLMLFCLSIFNFSIYAQGIGVILDDGSIDTLRKTKVDVQYRLEFCLGKCYQFVYIETPPNGTTRLFMDSLYWVFKGATPSYSTERNPYVCFDNPINVDT